jgi:hypothetical protein
LFWVVIQQFVAFTVFVLFVIKRVLCTFQLVRALLFMQKKCIDKVSNIVVVSWQYKYRLIVSVLWNTLRHRTYLYEASTTK